MTRAKIIGFDPGLECTGYGVIDAGGRHPILLEAGVLRMPTKATLAERLAHLYRTARELLEEHRPTAVAVEDLYGHYARPRTAILMGHARGVLLLAAGQLELPVTSYLPTRVKKSMTGSGRASKDQVQRAVQTEFALASPPEPPDVADALAVAVCHFHRLRHAVAAGIRRSHVRRAHSPR